MSQHCMYRAAYRKRYSDKLGEITFVTDSPFKAVKFAGDYTLMVKGYLLKVIEERSANIQTVLELK